MKRKFDKNDVLRFLYNEMEPVESEDFVLALSTKEELWVLFEECQAARSNLEKIEMEVPSSQTVLKILDHAKLSRRRSRSPFFSKNRLLSFQFFASLAMVFITVGTILVATMTYNLSGNVQTSLVREDLPALQWENTDFEQRMEHTRMNLRNLSQERTVISPFYHNTYQLINSKELSAYPRDVVLLNIK